jgi:hypothetical protein
MVGSCVKMFEVETQRQRFENASLDEIAHQLCMAVSKFGYDVLISVLGDDAKAVHHAMTSVGEFDLEKVAALDIVALEVGVGDHFAFDEQYSFRAQHEIGGANVILQHVLDRVVESTGQLYRVVLALTKENRIHYLSSAQPLIHKYLPVIEMIPDFEELLGDDVYHLLTITEPNLRQEVVEDIGLLASGYKDGMDFNVYFEGMVGTKKLDVGESRHVLVAGTRDIVEAGKSSYIGSGKLNRSYFIKGDTIYTQVLTDKVESMPVAELSYKRNVLEKMLIR